jgi:hypothetical protein
MTIRLKCRECDTAFVTSDDRLGRTVTCPKCGAQQQAIAQTSRPEPPAGTTKPFGPAAELAGEPGISRAKAADPQASVWVAPKDVDLEPEKTSRRRPWRFVAWGIGALVPMAAVALLVAWPRIQEWRQPTIKDAAEKTAQAFLQAVVKGDTKALKTLSTVEEPPAIRSFDRPRRDPARKQRLKGSFAPIAKMHAEIDKRFIYDPALGRYQTRNPLGPAAETLDALHDAKEQAKQQKVYEKMASGDPNDIFDAAESFGALFSKLAEGALAPKRLLPTYSQLVKETKPPLSPEAEALALDYGENHALWDTLLKRPFPTLKADGPFIFDRVDVVTRARDKLASSGDPPTTLRLTLTRFRLEGIDTGWKVTSARRDLPKAEVAGPASPPTQPSRSTWQSPGNASP